MDKTNKRVYRKSNRSRKILYQPSINQKLITLHTVKKAKLNIINTEECDKNNLIKIYQKLSTLELNINNQCYPHTDQVAIQFLLRNLSANKHIKVSQLITPKQYDKNCWFNVMFVTFFISDKGRIFFHFLRQLMIEGKQQDGKPLPLNLWNVFSLLNYFIELCKQGNPIALTINTNKIILNLHKIINPTHNITNVGEHGNPLSYYTNIITYLQNTDISVLRVPLRDDTWDMNQITFETAKPPHIIICEIWPPVIDSIHLTQFTISGYTYELDSACIRDTYHRHFSSCLHIEGVEYMYDGASQKRLFKRNWKSKLNSKRTWSFPGSISSYNKHNKQLNRWSFSECYHMLFYYRIN